MEQESIEQKQTNEEEQFSVVYRNGKDHIKVMEGNVIPISITQKRPRLHINHDVDEYFSVIMVDPDAPFPKTPTKKYWLHWIVINNNEEAVPYQPPDPPKESDKHRYCFFLFKQKKKLTPEDIGDVTNGGNFSLTPFTTKHGMTDVDCVYFKTGYKL